MQGTVSLTLSLSLTHTHTHTHTHTFSHSVSLSLTHTHTQTHTYSISLSFASTHTTTPTHSLEVPTLLNTWTCLCTARSTVSAYHTHTLFVYVHTHTLFPLGCTTPMLSIYLYTSTLTHCHTHALHTQPHTHTHTHGSPQGVPHPCSPHIYIHPHSDIDKQIIIVLAASVVCVLTVLIPCVGCGLAGWLTALSCVRVLQVALGERSLHRPLLQSPQQPKGEFLHSASLSLSLTHISAVLLKYRTKAWQNAT